MTRKMICLALALCLAPFAAAFAQQYDPGASATEIKLGQTVPLSGPVSVAGSFGRASLAFFAAVNKTGGINGRQIKLTVLDDGYTPPKTVEETRRLIEDDHVLAMFGSLGTPTNAAVQKYLNLKKIPQLFISTGASRFKDPTHYPWTMAYIPGYAAEGKAAARYALATVPNPKIAVLSQNDDFGKDFLAGFKAGLGDKAAKLIVSEQTYEVTDPSVDSQVVSAKASGANVFYFAGTQKAGAGQLRAVHNLGWKPLHVVCAVAAAIETVLKPAGIANAEGLISTAYAKDPFDPAWADDAETKAYLDWAKTWLTTDNPRDAVVMNAYVASFLMKYVLEKAGSNLTRANLLDIATHLHNVHVPMLLPGLTASTTPSDYSVIDAFQIQRFQGGRWVDVGGLISGK